MGTTKGWAETGGVVLMQLCADGSAGSAVWKIFSAGFGASVVNVTWSIILRSCSTGVLRSAKATVVETCRDELLLLFLR